MLTVHHLGVSQSDRIVWLCEELGIAYTLKRYARDPASGMAPTDYKALHPFGTAPVISDGDLTLGESGAIVEYIIAKYAQGRLTVGPEGPNFADYLFWFHFGNASFMPAMMMDVAVGMMGDSPEAEVCKNLGIYKLLGERTRLAYGMIEKRLGEAAYFGGPELTAADIMMLFPLTTFRMFAPRDLSGFPNVRAYLKRIGERPAFKRAMEKADPGMEMLLS